MAKRTCTCPIYKTNKEFVITSSINVTFLIKNKIYRTQCLILKRCMEYPLKLFNLHYTLCISLLYGYCLFELKMLLTVLFF